MNRIIGLIAALVAVASASPAKADDHYVAIFTAESVPFRSTRTHTFVVAARIPGPVNGVPCPVEFAHISWCPASLKQRGGTLRPECGVNLPVADTFAYCRMKGMRVSCWGPYRIEPELFDIIKCQAAKLESGRVLYKPTDNFYHSDVAANCYHAIWRPIAPHKKYTGPFNCGDVSGGITVRLFTPWLIEPCTTHDWLLDAIVPKGECVVRRGFDDRPTRRDAIRSARGS